MTSLPQWSFLAALGVLSLALAACSAGPKINGAPPAISTPADEAEAIAQLLDRGELREAQRRLDAALKQDRMNPSLLVLRQGIVGDAKSDLGPTSFPYTVAPGDTIASLAERFLGNRLKSYQLARYNDIANPANLAPGQVLKIPGEPARAQLPTRGTAPQTRPSRPAAPAPPARAPSPRAAPSLSPPSVVRTDPTGAQRARAAGLAALNKGQVNDAVELLQRAATLDPGNAAIKRDLERAQRIASTVRSRR